MLLCSTLRKPRWKWSMGKQNWLSINCVDVNDMQANAHCSHIIKICIQIKWCTKFEMNQRNECCWCGCCWKSFKHFETLVCKVCKICSQFRSRLVLPISDTTENQCGWCFFLLHFHILCFLSEQLKWKRSVKQVIN